MTFPGEVHVPVNQGKRRGVLRFVENTTNWFFTLLGEADELEDRVTIYRDMDLGKGQMQDPTAVKDPWKESRTHIVGPLVHLAATGWGAALQSESLRRTSSTCRDAARRAAAPGGASRTIATG